MKPEELKEELDPSAGSVPSVDLGGGQSCSLLDLLSAFYLGYTLKKVTNPRVEVAFNLTDLFEVVSEDDPDTQKDNLRRLIKSLDRDFGHREELIEKWVAISRSQIAALKTGLFPNVFEERSHPNILKVSFLDLAGDPVSAFSVEKWNASQGDSSKKRVYQCSADVKYMELSFQTPVKFGSPNPNVNVLFVTGDAVFPSISRPEISDFFKWMTMSLFEGTTGHMEKFPQYLQLPDGFLQVGGVVNDGTRFPPHLQTFSRRNWIEVLLGMPFYVSLKDMMGSVYFVHHDMEVANGVFNLHLQMLRFLSLFQERDEMMVMASLSLPCDDSAFNGMKTLVKICFSPEDESVVELEKWQIEAYRAVHGRMPSETEGSRDHHASDAPTLDMTVSRPQMLLNDTNETDNLPIGPIILQIRAAVLAEGLTVLPILKNLKEYLKKLLGSLVISGFDWLLRVHGLGKLDIARQEDSKLKAIRNKVFRSSCLQSLNQEIQKFVVACAIDALREKSCLFTTPVIDISENVRTESDRPPSKGKERIWSLAKRDSEVCFADWGIPVKDCYCGFQKEILSIKPYLTPLKKAKEAFPPLSSRVGKPVDSRRRPSKGRPDKIPPKSDGVEVPMEAFVKTSGHFSTSQKRRKARFHEREAERLRNEAKEESQKERFRRGRGGKRPAGVTNGDAAIFDVSSEMPSARLPSASHGEKGSRSGSGHGRGRGRRSRPAARAGRA